MKDNSNYDKKLLKNFLSYKANDLEESKLLISVFVFVNTFLLIPAITPPYNVLIAFIIIPIVFLLNIYGVVYKLLLSKKENKTNYFLLFKGIYGCLCSVGLFLISQKIAYSTNVFNSPMYFIFSLIGYLAILYITFGNLKRQSLIKEDKNTGTIPTSIPKMMAFFYLISNALVTYLSTQTFLFIVVIAFLILSWITMYSFFELYRLYCIKTKVPE